MNLELVCAGLLAFLLFGLGLSVSIERGRAGKLGGMPDDETTRLFRLIRAHGNSAEYVPVALAIALYFAVADRTTGGLVAIISMTAARYLHAFALIFGSSMSQFNLLRFIGGMGTYLAGFALSIILILNAF